MLQAILFVFLIFPSSEEETVVTVVFDVKTKEEGQEEGESKTMVRGSVFNYRKTLGWRVIFCSSCERKHKRRQSGSCQLEDPISDMIYVIFVTLFMGTHSVFCVRGENIEKNYRPNNLSFLKKQCSQKNRFVYAVYTVYCISTLRGRGLHSRRTCGSRQR